MLRLCWSLFFLVLFSGHAATRICEKESAEAEILQGERLRAYERLPRNELIPTTQTAHDKTQRKLLTRFNALTPESLWLPSGSGMEYSRVPFFEMMSHSLRGRYVALLAEPGSKALISRRQNRFSDVPRGARPLCAKYIVPKCFLLTGAFVLKELKAPGRQRDFGDESVNSGLKLLLPDGTKITLRKSEIIYMKILRQRRPLPGPEATGLALLPVYGDESLLPYVNGYEGEDAAEDMFEDGERAVEAYNKSSSEDHWVPWGKAVPDIYQKIILTKAEAENLVGRKVYFFFNDSNDLRTNFKWLLAKVLEVEQLESKSEAVFKISLELIDPADPAKKEQRQVLFNSELMVLNVLVPNS